MAISGSKALLTGANGGIGLAFIDELLRRGVEKLFLGVRTLEGHSFPDDARLELVRIDLADPASIAAAAQQVGDITLLINNAGYAAFTGVMGPDDISAARQEMEVNYFGPLQLIRALKDTSLYSADGAIINISSYLALLTMPTAGTYCASKAANLAMTRTLRAELKARGTRVISVLPVQVATRMGKDLPEPKVKPAEVAVEALDAVETGQDQVYPGEPSKGVDAAFRADPDALQAQLSQWAHSF